MNERILAPAAFIGVTAVVMSSAAIALLLSSPAANHAAIVARSDVLPFLSAVFSLIADTFWAFLQYL